MKGIVAKITEAYSLMGNRLDSNSPVYKDFMKHEVENVSKEKLIKVLNSKKFNKYYKCAGLWNHYCEECSKEDLFGLIDWMAACDVYLSSDSKSIFVHGFSESDMY